MVACKIWYCVSKGSFCYDWSFTTLFSAFEYFLSHICISGIVTCSCTVKCNVIEFTEHFILGCFNNIDQLHRTFTIKSICNNVYVFVRGGSCYYALTLENAEATVFAQNKNMPNVTENLIKILRYKDKEWKFFPDKLPDGDNRPLAIIACIGDFGTGKSTLNNVLLNYLLLKVCLTLLRFTRFVSQ